MKSHKSFDIFKFYSSNSFFIESEVLHEWLTWKCHPFCDVEGGVRLVEINHGQAGSRMNWKGWPDDPDHDDSNRKGQHADIWPSAGQGKVGGDYGVSDWLTGPPYSWHAYPAQANGEARIPDTTLTVSFLSRPVYFMKSARRPLSPSCEGTQGDESARQRTERAIGCPFGW